MFTADPEYLRDPRAFVAKYRPHDPFEAMTLRLGRMMAEWTDDMVHAAFLRGLPVAYVGTFADDPFARVVVLVGGHVWASRRWRQHRALSLLSIGSSNMTRTWKLSKPEARLVGGVWTVDVKASAPTTRPAPVLDCSCRNRCHCHTRHEGALAVWRKERETRSAEGVSFNLGDAMTKAYWNLGEVLK